MTVDEPGDTPDLLPQSMKPRVGVLCPACGGDAITRIRLGKPPFPSWHCLECELTWLTDPPSGDALSALYDSGYYGGSTPRGGGFTRALHQMNNLVRLRELDHRHTGHLLDVGCGKGRFLAAARNAGWHGVGIEFSDASATFAKEMYGIDVIVGDFASVSLSQQFDVVTLWHVLEHLADPIAALQRAASILRPGGRLVVSVPNNRSLQAKLGGDEWFHLDLPRHAFHFTPRSLEVMVNRAGLDVARIGYFYPEMEVVGLVQTVLNRSGLDGGRL